MLRNMLRNMLKMVVEVAKYHTDTVQVTWYFLRKIPGDLLQKYPRLFTRLVETFRDGLLLPQKEQSSFCGSKKPFSWWEIGFLLYALFLLQLELSEPLRDVVQFLSN